MTKTIKGLIIKETNVGEGDKIITILTPEYGKIQAVANGARSYKSKFIAGCQLFCYTNFVLSKKKDWFRVTSAEPIQSFYALRTSLEKLCLSTYFCDLLSEVTTDAHGADEIIKLALNTFYILTKEDSLAKIKATFELRLMSLSGFAPELSGCAVCGRKDGLTSFLIDEGALYCAECESKGKILPGTLLAMKHIVLSEPKKLFSYQASSEVLNEISLIAENYTLSHMGRDFRSLRYYLTIIKNMV